MSKFVFELNEDGVKELLRSPEMMNVLNGYATGIQARAGEGYTTKSFVGFDRAHVAIKAESPEAIHDNYENNTLERLIR